MTDAILKEELREKFETGELAPEDLPAVFDAFTYLGNQIDDIQDEVEGWNCVVEFDLTGLGTYWVAFEDQVFFNGVGKSQNADLRLILAAESAAQIFIGEKDAEAALNAGELKIDGDLPNAIRFSELLELVLEEIEY